MEPTPGSCRPQVDPILLATWTLLSGFTKGSPDSKVHGANMGPIWVLSAPDGCHVGPVNLAIREVMSVLDFSLLLNWTDLNNSRIVANCFTPWRLCYIIIHTPHHYRLSVYCGWMYRDVEHTTKEIKLTFRSDNELTKDTPYLALTGELWGVFPSSLDKRYHEISRTHCNVKESIPHLSFQNLHCCPRLWGLPGFVVQFNSLMWRGRKYNLSHMRQQTRVIRIHALVLQLLELLPDIRLLCSEPLPQRRFQMSGDGLDRLGVA